MAIQLGGCATGLGCLAGAGAGAGLGAISAAANSDQPGVNGAQLAAQGMVIGLICGCVAAEVARVRENALERQKRLEAEVEALRAAEAVRANAKTQPLPSAPPPP
jgi:Na+/glutamate symporter